MQKPPTEVTMSIATELNSFYLATLYFRMNLIEAASAECSKALEKNALDQAGDQADSRAI